MSILDEIFAYKREEVAERQRLQPLAAVRAAAENAAPARDFIGALRAAPRKPALIAEVKRASPSRGLLVADFDPVRLATLYAENGAAAISVLTDERYFRGSLDDLRRVALLEPRPLLEEPRPLLEEPRPLLEKPRPLLEEPRPPLLRKDFLYDPYQIYEARAAGADAVLLIAAHLPLEQMRDLHALALALGMAPLVEVHSPADLEAALQCNPVLVGVNNRDLHDFTVRLETTLSLRPLIPSGVCVVAESGLHSPADVTRMGAEGVDAVLIGEALVTATDIAAKVRSFVL
jgi:indole-3-glycerol phosphate synthase